MKFSNQKRFCLKNLNNFLYFITLLSPKSRGIVFMFLERKAIKKEDSELISKQARKKLLWSLRSEFAWTGKKVPGIVTLNGKEYRLQELLLSFEEKESLGPEDTAKIQALLPALKAGAEINENRLETEKLTNAEANFLYEEAGGLLRAEIEFKDLLEKRFGKKDRDLKKLLESQKVADEKRWQQFIKNIKY